MNKLEKPGAVLNPAYRKITVIREQINAFKAAMSECLVHIKINEEKKESEENIKKYIADFLKNSFYQEHLINTKNRIDLAVYMGGDANSNIGVLIEAKSLGNKNEFLSPDNINRKALQELLFYYLKERVTEGNNQIQHLIATNGYEWYLFKGEDFYECFYKNPKLIKEYKEFVSGQKDTAKNELFYNEIAKKYIGQVQDQLPFLYINIKDYEEMLPLGNTDDDKMVALYKVFSPIHLLGKPYGNDGNQLNKEFYRELLHIIGLEEVKEAGTKLIRRKAKKTRNNGSLLESAIFTLEEKDYLRKVDKLAEYGANREEQTFNVALELCLTWINRVLFLKLLESQLLAYHGGNPDYKFLHDGFVKGYDDLEELFFSALAKQPEARNERLKHKYRHIPYLNSSLFEPSSLEDKALQISNVKDADLELYKESVLKDNLKRKSGKLGTLEYLFDFLDAYDFSGEDGGKVAETNRQKSLISAAVLGLIFEKINGYKDGSFYTPAYISMYMARETLRKAALRKFNEHFAWDCKDFGQLQEDLKAYIRKGEREIIRKEANALIDSLKICDPAVGSGHFLVSCLNELIAIKSELDILIDKNSKHLGVYIRVENDELIVEDHNDEPFVYKPRKAESARIQETLFHEKQKLIENCLFGVDININSATICRLRLWIELLKNAYYTEGGALQTLPNIDINIKTGNSLISRFELADDLKTAFGNKENPYTLQDYKNAVGEYKRANDKGRKREVLAIIETIKTAFKDSLDKKFVKILAAARGRFELKLNDIKNLEAFGQKTGKKDRDELKTLQEALAKAEAEKTGILDNAIYRNAFEWRFEFPEVLDGNGDFLGFDVVIGNPPYIRHEEIDWMKDYLKDRFQTYTGTADVYVFFVERAFSVLKTRGHFSYIMPNKWMQSGYGKPLRLFLLDQCLQNIIDFGDLQVFDEATTYPCILEASKAASPPVFYSTLIQTLEYAKDFCKYVQSRKTAMHTAELDEETWVITSKEEQNILRKLKTSCIPLAEYVGGEAHYGIKTGLTEAFIVDKETYQNIVKEDKKSKVLLKPVLRGRDISRWYAKPAVNWLISTFPTLDIDIESYQGIKTHLLKWGIGRLEQSGAKDARKKTSGKWFETQDNIGYWKEFEKPKIMYQVFQVKPCFIYDDSGLYCNNSMWIIPKDDKTLLGILNSKMGWWLVSKYCTAIQNGYQLIWEYFGKTAIPKFTPAEAAPIEGLVNQIIAAKKSKKANAAADTGVWEKEIDARVFKLYGLSYDEVLVVDGGFGMGEEEYGRI